MPEEGTEATPITSAETQDSPPVEAPVITQTATTEHANIFQKLVARVQSALGGRRETSPTANTQPSASATETSQPLTPPTPGTPTI